jgi:Peptidase family M23
MATDTRIRSTVAAVLLVAASVAAASARPAAAAPAASTCGGTRTLFSTSAPVALRETTTLGRRPALPAGYGWPVKPFDRQHPVRAFLDDPRVGSNGGRAFHFGIDVAAPDGTPVYAVQAGEVFFDSRESIAVKVGPAHEFGYWHIKPVVRSHQLVRMHELLGTIAPGWGHVHFAERVGTTYVNPLRPGGLGPYTDPLPPDVAEIAVVRHGGGMEVLANAYDTTWPPVPGPWAHEPVAPALVQWRVVREGRPAPWRTAVDFRSRMLDRSLFDSVYAPPTAQNHKGKAGIYCFYLSHAWKPADGSYRIEVAASDTRGNRAIAGLDVTVAHGEVRS